MNIAVRYQSRSGNTRAVAEVIADYLGIKAESIDEPLAECVDILFLGGGAYAHNADPQLIDFIGQLNPEKVGQIIAFTTTGSMKVALDRITEYAAKKNIEINKNKLCIKMGLKGHATFGFKGGKLTKKQVENVRKFVDTIRKSEHI